MSRVAGLAAVLCLSGLSVALPASAHNATARPWTVADLALIHRLQAPAMLPPLAADTQVLRFEQFFRLPAGPRGLEPTPALLAAAGKRVRVFGYMVLHDDPRPGSFLLTPLPLTLAERADGQADDLPAAMLTVRLPEDPNGRPPPYVPGVLMLEGRLEVGAREEPDGRRSFVRLQLDWPPASAAAARGDAR